MKQILLAGRDQAIIELLDQVLRKLGYTSHAIRSALEVPGLSFAPFSAAIVDDNAELESLLQKSAPTLPIIRLCSTTQPSHAKGLVVSKPFRIQELAAAITHALQSGP